MRSRFYPRYYFRVLFVLRVKVEGREMFGVFVLSLLVLSTSIAQTPLSNHDYDYDAYEGEVPTRNEEPTRKNDVDYAASDADYAAANGVPMMEENPKVKEDDEDYSYEGEVPARNEEPTRKNDADYAASDADFAAANGVPMMEENPKVKDDEDYSYDGEVPARNEEPTRKNDADFAAANGVPMMEENPKVKDDEDYSYDGEVPARNEEPTRKNDADFAAANGVPMMEENPKVKDDEDYSYDGEVPARNEEPTRKNDADFAAANGVPMMEEKPKVKEDDEDYSYDYKEAEDKSKEGNANDYSYNSDSDYEMEDTAISSSKSEEETNEAFTTPESKEDSKKFNKEEQSNDYDYDEYEDDNSKEKESTHDAEAEEEQQEQPAKQDNHKEKEYDDEDYKEYEDNDMMEQGNEDYTDYDQYKSNPSEKEEMVPQRHRKYHHKNQKQSTQAQGTQEQGTQAPEATKALVEPSSPRVLVRHAIESYTEITKHKLETSRILRLYEKGDTITRKFVRTLFKVLAVIQQARSRDYEGFDEPEKVIALLQKDTRRLSDEQIVRFLYRYYKGYSGAKKQYLRLKVRYTSENGRNEDREAKAHDVHVQVQLHQRQKRNTKRDHTVKQKVKQKLDYKQKMIEFRKKRAQLVAELKDAHKTMDTVIIEYRNSERPIPILNRSKRSHGMRHNHHHEQRPHGSMLSSVYDAAQRQKAHKPGTTDTSSCSMPDGRRISEGKTQNVACNVCKCRKGELQCTQLKCKDRSLIEISGDLTGVPLPRNNACDKCNRMPNEEVCGMNGKTYNSLCHAINCANLEINEVRPGSCEIEEDPCFSSTCGHNEICLPRLKGPCVGLNNDGKMKSCSLYKCVPKRKCHRAKKVRVCGSDGKTHHSLCSLYHAKATLEYYGSCNARECSSPVCGSNSITYKSSCHAKAHSVHIDYTGKCLNERLSSERTCENVRSSKRCKKIDSKCKNQVIPEGSCCPVCGSSFTARPDTPEIVKLGLRNQLHVVKIAVLRLIPEIRGKCHFSVTLTDENNISFVIESANGRDREECISASKRLVEIINNSAEHADEIVDYLAPAALSQNL